MNKNFSNEKIYDEPVTYRIPRMSKLFTPLIDRFNKFEIYTFVSNPVINNPSGTPFDFQTIIISIKTTPGYTLTWGDQYKASGAELTTTTVGSKFFTFEFIWRSYDQKWHLVSNAQEA